MATEVTCPCCGGGGRVRTDNPSIPSCEPSYEKCPECNGRGVIVVVKDKEDK